LLFKEATNCEDSVASLGDEWANEYGAWMGWYWQEKYPNIRSNICPSASHFIHILNPTVDWHGIESAPLRWQAGK
jgi:hypothetical protein